jgi:SAM-dependent methyltransferase
MAVVKGLETMFNAVASEYDKWRSTYVQALYEDIFAYHPIDPSSNVLEIGIGTGQATGPILETGCTLTAVEIGDQLAEYTRQKYRQYHNFQVIHLPFQDYECPPDSFDLIYSASAFHWIPKETGYPKVYDLLKSGGVFVGDAEDIEMVDNFCLSREGRRIHRRQIQGGPVFRQRAAHADQPARTVFEPALCPRGGRHAERRGRDIHFRAENAVPEGEQETARGQREAGRSDDISVGIQEFLHQP